MTIGEVLQAALAVLREVLDPVRGGAVLVDEDAVWPTWRFAAGSDEIIATRRTDGLEEPVLSVLRDGVPHFYESADEPLAEFGSNGVPGHFRCAGIHLPLEVDGVTVGVMGCEFAGTRRISVEEHALALSLASLSAEAVRRARLYEEERRNAGRHAMLRALGEALATTTTPAEGLAALATALRSHLGPLQVQAVLERGGLLHPPEGAVASGPRCTAVDLEGRPAEEAASLFPGDERPALAGDARRGPARLRRAVPRYGRGVRVVVGALRRTDPRGARRARRGDRRDVDGPRGAAPGPIAGPAGPGRIPGAGLAPRHRVVLAGHHHRGGGGGGGDRTAPDVAGGGHRGGDRPRRCGRGDRGAGGCGVDALGAPAAGRRLLAGGGGAAHRSPGVARAGAPGAA